MPGGLVDGPGNALYVIPAQQAHPGEPRQPKRTPQLSQQVLRLYGKAGPLLHIASKYVPHS